MLSPGHLRVINQAARLEWLVYGVVALVLVIDAVLGLYVSRGLGRIGALRGAEALAAWAICVGIVAVQAVAAYRLQRWLIRPATIRRRLDEALRAAGVPGPAGPERLTVAALRSSFLARVSCWFLLQFIVAYGIVLAVLTGSLIPVVAFTVLAAALLVPVRPSARALEDLALRLHRSEARAD